MKKIFETMCYDNIPQLTEGLNKYANRGYEVVKIFEPIKLLNREQLSYKVIFSKTIE